MQLKKLLALLLSAALALSLLAGCGGESVARSLLALLDGKYANVSVEMDPDLEADLRQALSETENDDEAAIRAALETLLGSTITFRYLGEGQQGDTAFDLIFYAGADPDKAAQSAYSQWNGTFSNLPDDGLYTAALAQVQTENGVWLLVQATVDKAGTVDKPDKDDDEPETQEPPEQEKGYSYDETSNTYTVKEADGLQELFNDKNDSFNETTVIKLTAGKEYTVNQQLAADFKGTLQGENETNKATITLTDGCNGLFQQISGGTVENITFEVQTNITEIYADVDNRCAGAVAGVNHGNITNCDVTINSDCTIQAASDGISAADAGGLVGLNYGTITDCTVTINGSITADGDGKDDFYAGGIAGENQGTISNCDVKGSYEGTGDAADDDISAAANGYMVTCAGGIAGCNQGTGTVENCSVSSCKIKAGDNGQRIAAGGIVGWSSDKEKVNCKSATDCYITAVAGDQGSATVPNDFGMTAIRDQFTGACAGAKIGYNDETGEPVG